MSEEYVCPGCQRLVSFSGGVNTWIVSWCSHCGFSVSVMVQEKDEEEQNE